MFSHELDEQTLKVKRKRLRELWRWNLLSGVAGGLVVPVLIFIIGLLRAGVVLIFVLLLGSVLGVVLGLLLSLLTGVLFDVIYSTFCDRRQSYHYWVLRVAATITFIFSSSLSAVASVFILALSIFPSD